MPKGLLSEGNCSRRGGSAWPQESHLLGCVASLTLGSLSVFLTHRPLETIMTSRPAVIAASDFILSWESLSSSGLVCEIGIAACLSEDGWEEPRCWLLQPGVIFIAWSSPYVFGTERVERERGQGKKQNKTMFFIPRLASISELICKPLYLCIQFPVGFQLHNNPV